MKESFLGEEGEKERERERKGERKKGGRKGTTGVQTRLAVSGLLEPATRSL